MSTIQSIDYSVDLLKFLLWQRNNAPAITAILQAEQDWYGENVTAFLSDWYTNVFNLDTANDFGLTVWAIILDQPQFASVPRSSPNSPAFGFGGYNENFNNGNFRLQNGSTYALGTEQRRALLKMRYLLLTSRATTPEINRALAVLTGVFGGSAAVVDGFPTGTLAIRFFGVLPSIIDFVIATFDVIPRPAGVRLLIIRDATPFGLCEDDSQPPAHSNFFSAMFAE